MKCVSGGQNDRVFMSDKIFHGRNVIFVQPALPSYRLDFFDRLYKFFGERLYVYYSPGNLGALTKSVNKPWAYEVGAIRPLPARLAWQSSVTGIPLEKGDILILSGNPRQLSTLSLLLKAKLRGVHTVWWGHYWSSSSRRWRQVVRFLPMALADAILFYTDAEVEQYKNDRMASKSNKHVTALNNGVNDVPIRQYRRPYNASERERAFLFIGRLTRKANVALALRALARLGDKAPALHVVGDGEEAGELKALSATLGLSSKVYWHGATTDEELIGRVANRCRAFLYPGEVGLSLVHAMAYGLPAIVHNERRLHMPEIAAFKDGVTGRSFSYEDDVSLAAGLCDLIDRNDYLDELHEAVASVMVDSFTTKSMSERFKGLVNKMSDI